MPPQRLSALHEATSLWSPHGSPAGAAHQPSGCIAQLAAFGSGLDGGVGTAGSAGAGGGGWVAGVEPRPQATTKSTTSTLRMPYSYHWLHHGTDSRDGCRSEDALDPACGAA